MKGSDFNDEGRSRSDDEVRERVDGAEIYRDTARLKHGEEDLTNAPLVPRRIPDDFDFAKIPRRPWVLGTRLQRKLLSELIAPGGVGKSRLMAATAMSIASSRSLTGEHLHERGPVWLINNEDNQDEMDRNVAALCIHHGIRPAQIRDTLFYNSGFDRPVLVAKRSPDGSIVHAPDVEEIIRQCEKYGIIALLVDPFIATHEAQENDNTEMNKAARAFVHIAIKANVAVEVAHHVIKNSTGNTEAHAGIADAGRGGGALKDAARIATTLARMSQKTADVLGIEPAMARRLIRMDMGKENQSISDAEAKWFKLESVRLPNGDGPLILGDSVGVIEPFDMATFADLKRMEQQTRKDEAAEPKRVSVAEFICRSLKDKQAPISSFVGTVKDEFGGCERTARNRINDAIPKIPRWRPVEIDGQQWELGRRPIDPQHPRSPAVIVKSPVRQD